MVKKGNINQELIAKCNCRQSIYFFESHELNSWSMYEFINFVCFMIDAMQVLQYHFLSTFRLVICVDVYV